MKTMIAKLARAVLFWCEGAPGRRVDPVAELPAVPAYWRMRKEAA